MEKEIKKGTTTVGIVCKDTVVIAADQLATLGDFKFNTDTKKIEEITNKIVMTTAGSVGDNQSLVRFLKAQMKLYSLEETEPTVKSVVTLLSNILSDKYLYSYLPYSIFNLLGGFDTKPRLFSIDLVGGSGEEKKYAATGSGMTLAYSILDSEFHEAILPEKAVELAIKSIVAARKRVSSVGGENITVYTINEKGLTEISPAKVKAIADKL